ncbi:MAG: ABC transporter ATP-binding protein, partial [Phycisphaerales bacterium]
MIETDGLWKVFGGFAAVRGVSFAVPKGQIVGFLGPNGAGKTTTIRMLTGYTAPSAGTARVAGFDCVEQSHEVRRRIGYLPESAPLYREMRVADYLDYRGRLFGMARAERRRAAGAAMDRCWLKEVARKRIGQLSKGYRQRVGLASALLHDPEVLILDEPTSGLDPSQIVETRRLLRSLAGERTLLLSSHILPEVERTCERIIVIARGTIRADGSPEELTRTVARGRPLVLEARLGGDDPGATLTTAAHACPGVGMAVAERMQDGWIRVRIEPGDGADDLREPVAQAMARAGAVVRELRAEGATLE